MKIALLLLHRTHWILCLVVISVISACASEESGIAPPRDGFYFPVSLALDPKRPFLYVVNSNADLKYNGATIEAIDLRLLPTDLSQIEAKVNAGEIDCRPGPSNPTIWECPENAADPNKSLILKTATLRIGNFPSDIVGTSDGERLFIPVRGENYLLWVEVADIDGEQVDLRCNRECSSAGNQNCEQWNCDSDHQVSYSQERQRQLPTEPYGVYLNEVVAVHVDTNGLRRTCRDGLSDVSCTCEGQRLCQEELDDRDCCISPPQEDQLFVTHMSTGEISFFSYNSTEVKLIDVKGGFFTNSGDIHGGFGLAAQTPGDSESLIYASSRLNNVLPSFSIRNNLRIIDGPKATISAINPGSDVRGIAFGPGGQQLYLVDRLPQALVALDMAPQDHMLKAPKQEPIWTVEVCTDPSIIRLGKDPLHPEDMQSRLAYVVCFGSAQIFVVDTNIGKVVDQIPVGKGPNSLVLDNVNQRAFIANFLENTVGIIDLNPIHKNYNRMVLRIGRVSNLAE